MIDALILRIDAPLISFGGTMVDRHSFTEHFPTWSMLTGLLANALGMDHRDSSQIQALQDRIVFAVRCDRPGRKIVDFQTVDLGQPFLDRGWTTRGIPEGRAGSVSKETHIRMRHYVEDAVYTVALTLDPAKGYPSLIELGFALKEPERPLFFGRKSCLPAAPVFIRMVPEASLRAALEHEPCLPEHRSIPGARLKTRGPGRDFQEGQQVSVTDKRDWANQIHVGRRVVYESTIIPTPYITQECCEKCG